MFYTLISTSNNCAVVNKGYFKLKPCIARVQDEETRQTLFYLDCAVALILL